MKIISYSKVVTTSRELQRRPVPNAECKRRENKKKEEEEELEKEGKTGFCLTVCVLFRLLYTAPLALCAI
jgi:hypothetical protein